MNTTLNTAKSDGLNSRTIEVKKIPLVAGSSIQACETMARRYMIQIAGMNNERFSTFSSENLGDKVRCKGQLKKGGSLSYSVKLDYTNGIQY